MLPTRSQCLILRSICTFMDHLCKSYFLFVAYPHTLSAPHPIKPKCHDSLVFCSFKPNDGFACTRTFGNLSHNSLHYPQYKERLSAAANHTLPVLLLAVAVHYHTILERLSSDPHQCCYSQYPQQKEGLSCTLPLALWLLQLCTILINQRPL